ncbi:DUF1653 domain-containing protein [Bacillus thuringiensis]|uniref:DUF1653 domain-containing protein n=1 Tax=Bacillus thuringiensis TaxID=1428 RepID=UPI000BFD00A3|nr:DUF1653 domain-containing protein [Bacillus thuringiensis]PGT90134.1 hypothetical protein COD17_10320 [Bacillus thuringiensis]
MINGTFYRHYNNNKEYFFDSIALPVSEFRGKKGELESMGTALDSRTPKGEPVQELNLFYYKGVKFIESKKPMVIYQSEEDYDTDKSWAREVDEFFGYVEKDRKLVKRFVKIGK